MSKLYLVTIFHFYLYFISLDGILLTNPGSTNLIERERKNAVIKILLSSRRDLRYLLQEIIASVKYLEVNKVIFDNIYLDLHASVLIPCAVEMGKYAHTGIAAHGNWRIQEDIGSLDHIYSNIFNMPLMCLSVMFCPIFCMNCLGVCVRRVQGGSVRSVRRVCRRGSGWGGCVVRVRR